MILAGQKVLITRAENQAPVMKEKLEAAGAIPVILPVIEFKEPQSFKPLDDNLKNLSKFNWIIFASANAVRAVLRRLEKLNLDTGALADLKVGAIGPATGRALEERGIKVDFKPSKFVAEDFIEEFPDSDKLDELKILWPRTNVGRTLIHDQLTASGASVSMVEAYRTELPENVDELSDKLFEMCQVRSIDMITFASSQTVKNFQEILNRGLIRYASSRGYIVNPESRAIGGTASALLGDIAIATIGPVTTKTARAHLKDVDVESAEHTIDALVEAICRFYNPVL